MSQFNNPLGNDDKQYEQGLVQVRCVRSADAFSNFMSPGANSQTVFKSSSTTQTYDIIHHDICFKVLGDPANQPLSFSHGLVRSANINVMAVLNGITLDGIDP